jgi:3-deoxy-D-manno-octulosonic-acid transferase
MWKIAYNVGILCALPFFTLLALFKKKIRMNFMERLFPAPVDRTARGGIWVHAASVGEAVIAENLISYMTRESGRPFVITTNTYYTRDLLRKRFRDPIEVCSAPLDLPFSIRRFIGSRRFEALLIVETEIWPNTIWMAKARGIPVVIVNGRISDSTIGRYGRLSFFLRTLFRAIDLVLVQSDDHARRFLSLGLPPEKGGVTGNLKYYREIKELPDHSRERAITFGSIREKELPILMPVIQALADYDHDLRIYVAPRELRLVSRIEECRPDGLTISRYSRLKDNPLGTSRLVVVDTVGDLLGIYARSLLAFVGGSLAPYGGQNMLEPLFVQTPVIFGPSVENFKAVAEAIVNKRAGIMVRDGDGLYSTIKDLLGSEPARQRLVDAGKIVIGLQRDAMEKTARHILETIWKNSARSSN